MVQQTASDAISSVIERLDDLVSAKWTLQILRELSLGPARFSSLRRAIPSISANVLSARLRRLEAFELIRRETLPEPAGCQVYELTNGGAAARGVLKAITEWAEALTGLDTGVAPEA